MTSTTDWERLAQHIRERREELGLTTRRAFVHATGLSYRLLGDLERGARTVSGGTLARVEQALDWQPGSAQAILLGGEATSRDRPGGAQASTPATWMRSMSEAYRIAAELTESGQLGMSGRLTRALSDISQQLMAYSMEPEPDPDEDAGTGADRSGAVQRTSTPGANGPQPTVLGIALGKYMRELRERKGLTSQRASEILEWQSADVWLFELGHITLDKKKIQQLLRLYGITEQRIHRECVRAAGHAERSGWWTRYNAVLPTWLQGYLPLEQTAGQIRIFEAHFIPGLLQTQEYARSIIGYCYAMPPSAEDQKHAAKKVNVRLTRQRILDRPNGPRLWAIIDETAISHAMVSDEVIADQIVHLIEMARRANVTIQILPAKFRWLSGFSTTFTLLRLDEKSPTNSNNEVVYTEQLTSALYLDSHQDLHEYRMTWDRLAHVAMTPDESVQFLIGLRDNPAAVIQSHALIEDLV